MAHSWCHLRQDIRAMSSCVTWELCHSWHGSFLTSSETWFIREVAHVWYESHSWHGSFVTYLYECVTSTFSWHDQVRRLYMCICICACIHTYIHKHINWQTPARRSAHTYAPTHFKTLTLKHTHTHTHTHTHKHTHTYMHTHAHTCDLQIANMWILFFFISKNHMQMHASTCMRLCLCVHVCVSVRVQFPIIRTAKGNAQTIHPNHPPTPPAHLRTHSPTHATTHTNHGKSCWRTNPKKCARPR